MQDKVTAQEVTVDMLLADQELFNGFCLGHMCDSCEINLKCDEALAEQNRRDKAKETPNA
jgi:hypothetical protein